jgi:hypothetical protein
MAIPSKESHLFRRLFAYCDERFPPIAYSVLVLLFFSSAVGVYQDNIAFDMTWLGSLVMLLAFFHLRIFDEFKDFHMDRFVYPDRILSKGIVSLTLLGRLNCVVIIVQAVCSVLLGKKAFFCWLVVLGFSLLMRIEFGIGKWLERRMLLYAVTHNPIVALLAIFAWGCTEAQWDWQFLWYVAAITFGSFAFEIGRKTKLPEEERTGVNSYSSVYGYRKTLWIINSSVVLGVICSIQTMIFFGSANTMVAYGILLFSVLTWMMGAIRAKSGKHIELASTVFLLLSMLSIGVGTW